MSEVTIYHNPHCGTSRNVLGLIRNAGIEPTIIEYLKAPPDRQTLLGLIKRMGIRVRELLRRKGSPYDELGLDPLCVSATCAALFLCLSPRAVELSPALFSVEDLWEDVQALEGDHESLQNRWRSQKKYPLGDLNHGGESLNVCESVPMCDSVRSDAKRYRSIDRITSESFLSGSEQVRGKKGCALVA